MCFSPLVELSPYESDSSQSISSQLSCFIRNQKISVCEVKQNMGDVKLK